MENAVEFNVSFCYENDTVPALNHVCGKIKKGNVIVLCGESGCGKSSLLRVINKLIPDFYEGKPNGTVKVFSEDIQERSIGEVGLKVSTVFQDPRSQFFTVNSTNEVAFSLENRGCEPDEMHRRIDQAFKTAELEKLKGRKVLHLSSGEKQLVSILSTYASDAEILLLDEPSANLDAQAIQDLTRLLGQLKDMGKTLIVSEHRLYYLKNLADEFWLIKNGEITERYPAKILSGWCAEELATKGLRIIDLQDVQLEEKTAPLSRSDATSRLELKNLGFSYKRNEPIFSAIKTAFFSGEVVGLIGSNGSGKTTLGKCMSGLNKPETGSILFNGKPLSKKQLRANSMFIMQEAEFQFFTNSVLHEVLYGHSDEKYKKQAEQILRTLGLWKYRNRHPYTLSGGQMQRLSLALACLSDKSVIVLDEPTAGLDYRNLQHVVQAIHQMKENKIVIVITHDLELIRDVCDRCIGLRDGALKELRPDQVPSFIRQFSMKDNRREIPEKEYHYPYDPRITMLWFLLTIIAASTNDRLLIVMVMLGMYLMLVFMGKWLRGLIYLSVFAIVEGLYLYNSSFAWGIVSALLPRLMLIGMSAELMFSADGATQTLAAMRKLHFPEKVIMSCAVIFRFFPVIINDMQIERQAMQTRGIYSGFHDFLKKPAEYIEFVIVPMLFRVIRIAECLSASAEIRGIDLKIRKTSYLQLHMKVSDYFLGIIGIALFIIRYTLLSSFQI